MPESPTSPARSHGGHGSHRSPGAHRKPRTHRSHRSHRRRSRRGMVAASLIAAVSAGAAFTATLPGAAEATPAARTVSVSTAAELTSALAGAKPGDTIKLADGTYRGRFKATADGTPSAAITLSGSSRAVLTSTGGNGYGLWLSSAPYWKVRGITVDNSVQGIVMDASPHVTLDDVHVHDIDYGAVRFRSDSDHGVVRHSNINDAGK